MPCTSCTVVHIYTTPEVEGWHGGTSIGGGVLIMGVYGVPRSQTPTHSDYRAASDAICCLYRADRWGGDKLFV